MKTNFVRWLLRLYLAMALLFVFLPVISLVLFSFDETSVPSFPIQRYSVRWYQSAWQNPDIREGLINSLMVGATVGALSTALGFLSAHFLSRHKVPFQAGYIALVSLPVVVPLLLSGMALLMYFRELRLVGSLWAVIIAHVSLCSPFALAILRNPYERLNVEIEQAASNLGASQFRVIFQVVVPQLWASITAAALLSFLVSWDEFVLAWFVGGFQRTLPVVIYGMMGASFSPSLNAVGTLSMAVSLALLGCVFVLQGVGSQTAGGR